MLVCCKSEELAHVRITCLIGQGFSLKKIKEIFERKLRKALRVEPHQQVITCI